MRSFSKILYTFALSHLHNRVNHRIYRNEINALGVVSLCSFYSVKCGCDNLRESHASLFNQFFKIFTQNVTPSRKFESGESQYPEINVIFTKRRNQLTIFSSTRLYFRKFCRFLRISSTKIFQDQYSKRRQNKYCFRNIKKGSFFWSRKIFQRSISKAFGRYLSESSFIIE